MMNRHLRKAVVVTAAITTAGLMMTACRNGSSSGTSKSSGSASSSKSSDMSDTSKSSSEQTFFVADDTQVHGAGTIRGSPGSTEMSLCTLDELEAAAKKGVSAKVRTTDGVATSITEDR